MEMCKECGQPKGYVARVQHLFEKLTRLSRQGAIEAQNYQKRGKRNLGWRDCKVDK